MFINNPFLQKFYSPNILAVASSLVGEDSLSHHVDPAIGVYIIDRYSCVQNMLHMTLRNTLLLMIVDPLINVHINQALKIPNEDN